MGSVSYCTDDIRALHLTPGGGVADPLHTSFRSWSDRSGALCSHRRQRRRLGILAVRRRFFYQRFMRGGRVEAAATAVPDTNVGATNQRPTAVRDADGAVWLFWVSDRGGSNDVWFIRRNPDTGGWGQARQLTASPGDDNQPFSAIAPNGVIWLFWRSNRTGNYDLYFKQLVTAI